MSSIAKCCKVIDHFESEGKESRRLFSWTLLSTLLILGLLDSQNSVEARQHSSSDQYSTPNQNNDMYSLESYYTRQERKVNVGLPVNSIVEARGSFHPRSNTFTCSLENGNLINPGNAYIKRLNPETKKFELIVGRVSPEVILWSKKQKVSEFKKASLIESNGDRYDTLKMVLPKTPCSRLQGEYQCIFFGRVNTDPQLRKYSTVTHVDPCIYQESQKGDDGRLIGPPVFRESTSQTQHKPVTKGYTKARKTKLHQNKLDKSTSTRPKQKVPKKATSNRSEQEKPYKSTSTISKQKKPKKFKKTIPKEKRQNKVKPTSKQKKPYKAKQTIPKQNKLNKGTRPHQMELNRQESNKQEKTTAKSLQTTSVKSKTDRIGVSPPLEDLDKNTSMVNDPLCLDSVEIDNLRDCPAQCTVAIPLVIVIIILIILLCGVLFWNIKLRQQLLSHGIEPSILKKSEKDDKNQNRYDNHETEGLLEPVQTYTMTRPEPETNEPFYVYADTWHQMQMPQHVSGHFKSNKPRLKRQRVRSMPAPEVSSDEEIYYVYGP